MEPRFRFDRSVELARELKIAAEHLEPYGRDKAKVRLEALKAAEARHPSGKLILVSAITPTPAGEGKTTTSIGLSMGLNRIGHRSALALRQPSMGPVFGRKGGATGGGASRIEPSNTINLQFTGDFHAITAAHNLLAAAIDNRLHFGDLDLDPTRVLWKRALDMNDRALRHIVIGLGGHAQGVPRESGFDITAASEVMAILCLADSPADLRARLDRILVGYSEAGEPVLAKSIGVTGAMTAILNEAMMPNLVQTAESTPAFVHGGPFANIAHGCNSILATRMALAMADYAVTEAGFAFDLGGEKFFDLKCRAGRVQSGRDRARRDGSSAQDARRRQAGRPQRLRSGGRRAGTRKSGRSPRQCRPFRQADGRCDQSVRVRHLRGDQGRTRLLRRRGSVACATADVFGAGGKGASDLAEKVVAAASEPVTPLKTLYPLDWPAERKIEQIARTMYGAADVNILPAAASKLRKAAKLGYGGLPICMAKTQDSLSDNPKLRGRPRGFTLTVRDVEIAAGAGFLVALTGDIVRMPGLPERPAAERIDVDLEGRIVGLS